MPKLKEIRKMLKNKTKSKMTLNRLATITQQGFLDVKESLTNYIEGRLHLFKEDVREVVRDENIKVLQSNDRVVTKLDILLKEEAARTEQYKRHDRDISMLKQKVGV